MAPCYGHVVSGSLALHRYTYRDYLRVEEDSTLLRHEFLDGEIYAMAGGTPEHGAISANVIAQLAVQLRGRGCRVHSSDVRIRVLATGLATYPDVSVVCSHADLDPEDRNAIVNPIVIVEVLSPGTADYDRGEKLAHYKQIPSLREVVLVDHAARALEIWRRDDKGVWSSAEVRDGDVRLESVGATVALDDVYRDELVA